MKRHLHIPASTNYQYPTGELQSLTKFCLVEFSLPPTVACFGQRRVLKRPKRGRLGCLEGFANIFHSPRSQETNSRKQNKTEYFNKKEN